MAEAENNPSILPVMIGTAGHVDHGKTSLVKLLTGCDTDRLREEKERGLSIDLGFAACKLPGDRLVGIIDVPGHEDFIRNMVAGAASIDVLLLVVAADDGVMPQTLEHLKIVQTLRMPKVMAAITKIDLVDGEMVEIARQETQDFLARAGFPDAPVVPVSNTKLTGIGDIRRELQSLVESVERKPDRRAFRMYVERVFSVKGYGTVATGIPVSGKIAAGEGIRLLPEGKSCAVRAVQSYKIESNVAVAGACAAVNLRDIDVSEAGRGMALSSPGAYRPTKSLVVSLTGVHEKIYFKKITKGTFHVGTGSTQASVKLIGDERFTLRQGAACFAQIRLDEEMPVAAGDRFIFRSLSPVTTIGGGVVLSARECRIRRSEAGLQDRLARAKDAALCGDVLASELLAGAGAVVLRDEAGFLSQCEEHEAKKYFAELEERGVIADIGGGWIIVERAKPLAEGAQKMLAAYHADNPYVWGMDPAAFCSGIGVPPECFKKLSKILCAASAMCVRHGRICLDSFSPALSAKQMELRESVLGKVMAEGVNAPAIGTMAKEFSAAASDMKLIVRLLCEEGLVVRIDNNLMGVEVWSAVRDKLVDLFAQKDIVSLSDYREATGLSRNLAVALLDRFDTEGLTRRVEDGRVLADASVLAKEDSE